MKKVEKRITEVELEKIKSLTSEISNCKAGISDFEIRKHALISRLFQSENEFSKLQGELMEKYGKVSININDGTIKEEEENASNS